MTRTVRLCLISALYSSSILIALAAATIAELKVASTSVSEKKIAAARQRQEHRVYSLLDHCIRICVYTFLSAVFAGLTLGVMCADTFTLEIIAESGPKPDCKYAATILPLRRGGHKTLCTLIISNMLCNVLIVQEFADVFDIIHAIRFNGNANTVVDDSGSALVKFIVSSFVIVLFAEILPMAICRSKYSLRVASAGSNFVYVAMFLTYPISMLLGKFLDWVVGCEETGQIYDRNELRRLMVVHYERFADGSEMPMTELNLLLAAMDFQERRVKDIMTPIADVVYVNDCDEITSDFVARLWLSGKSRVPVRSEAGEFYDVLVVKDLLTVNIMDVGPLTVSQLVRSRSRFFGMIGESNTLPSLLKFFQEAKTHMAVVYAEEDGRQTMLKADASFARTRPEVWTFNGADLPRGPAVGIVTMEDVVEELLNDEIYDEYDDYDHIDETPRGPKTPCGFPQAAFPEEPRKQPRVNFYSYFTHPETAIPLTDSQVWAVAYYLNRTVASFMLWPPGRIKELLENCQDEQLVVPVLEKKRKETTSHLEIQKSPTHSAPGGDGAHASAVNLRGDHHSFVRKATGPTYCLYSRQVPSSVCTIILGGSVEVLVGSEGFMTTKRSFECMAEGALTTEVYSPDFSAVVTTAARIYRISKETYDRFSPFQMEQRFRTDATALQSVPRTTTTNISSNNTRGSRSRQSQVAQERRSLLWQSASAVDMSAAYGTFGSA